MLHERARRSASLDAYEQALSKFERARELGGASPDAALMSDIGRCEIDYAVRGLVMFLSLLLSVSRAHFSLGTRVSLVRLLCWKIVAMCV